MVGRCGVDCTGLMTGSKEKCMKKHIKWKRSEIIILCALGMLGIAGIVALFSILLEYKTGDATYHQMESYVLLPEEEQENIPPRSPGSSHGGTGQQDTAGEAAAYSENQVYYGKSPQVDFDGLKARNSDVVGWIYGSGTAINYPVVQGSDNEYYLTHMVDGRENKCGSIFMDSLNAEDFSNDNSIVHGHHMRNGSMFAGLTQYAAQSYYDAHPVMWLVTPDKSYQVEIFTGFVTTADSGVWQIEFASQEEYGEWLTGMKEASSFESGVKPDTKDHIITLATCSYENSDSRFVVMGILREQQTQ